MSAELAPDRSVVASIPAGLMALLVQTPRLLGVTAPRPREIHFRHRCFHQTEPYRRFFEAPVYFGSTDTVLRTDRGILELPIPSADAQTARYLADLAERLASELPAPGGEDYVARVQAAIRAALQDGDASLPRVAKILATSVRTIQRRLGEAGTSFADLQDRTYQQAAASLLRRSSTQVHEVAFILGYSDPSSFHRAFKRWTGKTPEQYRRESQLREPGLKVS